MDKIAKFLRSVPHLRFHLTEVLEAIVKGKTDGLDIKPLEGYKNVFRCRVGKVRILFERTNGRNIPRAVGFRKDIYKKR